MSSSNRHRARRRSYERSNYNSYSGSRQDSSSRYINDTPPRFANRRTNNGDTSRDPWDDKGGYQNRREGGVQRQSRGGSYGMYSLLLYYLWYSTWLDSLFVCVCMFVYIRVCVSLIP